MFYISIPHPCQPNSSQHCPLPRLWLTTDPAIPHFRHLCCWGCSGGSVAGAQDITSCPSWASSSISLCCPRYRSHHACSVQRKANALRTYKPLSNPRPGMLLITYTYPCTLLITTIWTCFQRGQGCRERWREDWPVSHTSLLFATAIGKWPLIPLNQAISQVVTWVVHCD